MKPPVINVQEAYILSKSTNLVINNVTNIRPPYKKCYLMYRPVEGVTVIQKVTQYGDESIKIEGYSVLDEDQSMRDLYWLIVPISSGCNPRITQAFVEGKEELGERHIRAALFSLNLLNCKNIKYISYDPNKAIKRQAKRQREREKKAPYVKYEILEIQPMRERVKAKNKLPSEFDNNQRLHTVRGHFKTFTQDNPLFGKLTGTYWWGDCIKGNAEFGLLEKDYRILVDQDILSLPKEMAGQTYDT